MRSSAARSRLDAMVEEIELDPRQHYSRRRVHDFDRELARGPYRSEIRLLALCVRRTACHFRFLVARRVAHHHPDSLAARVWSQLPLHRLRTF